MKENSAHAETPALAAGKTEKGGRKKGKYRKSLGGGTWCKGLNQGLE